MKRLLTAAVGVPLALVAMFTFPPLPFFLLVVALLGWGAVEYAALIQRLAPSAPRWIVAAAFVPTAAAATWVLAPGPGPAGEAVVLVLGAIASVGVGGFVLGCIPAAEAPVALGLVAFGVPYFAMPAAAICVLQRLDPWLLLLLCAIVWLGDTAAYYVGTAWGRHKLAPEVSPNKSWEGAWAGLATAVGAAIVWCVIRLGTVDWVVVAVAAVTGIASQLGDLVESQLKRSVGVKDSGNVLPGHGGMLDRMDAILFGAPVLLLGLWVVGFEEIVL